MIADGLVRLLAPILPMTADELWRHLPGPREASVHIAEFPRDAEVAALLDAELVARWERLIGDPRRRQRALEVERDRTRRSATRSARGSSLRAGGDDRRAARAAIATTCRCCSSCRRSASRSASGGDDPLGHRRRARGRRQVRALLAHGRRDLVEPRDRWPVRSLRRRGRRIAGRMTDEPDGDRRTARPGGADAAGRRAGGRDRAARYARPVEIVTILSVAGARSADQADRPADAAAARHRRRSSRGCSTHARAEHRRGVRPAQRRGVSLQAGGDDRDRRHRPGRHRRLRDAARASTSGWRGSGCR